MWLVSMTTTWKMEGADISNWIRIASDYLGSLQKPPLISFFKEANWLCKISLAPSYLCDLAFRDWFCTFFTSRCIPNLASSLRFEATILTELFLLFKEKKMLSGWIVEAVILYYCYFFLFPLFAEVGTFIQRTIRGIRGKIHGKLKPCIICSCLRLLSGNVQLSGYTKAWVTL